MPRHAYTARREPPSLLDKLLFHPFELSFGLLWLIVGVLLILDIFVPGFTLSLSMDNPPAWAAAGIALCFVFAAVSIGRGLLYDSPELDRDWLAERVGLVAGSVGLLGYTIAVVFTFPHSTLSWIIPLSMTMPCGLRIWATIREERYRREVQQKTAPLVRAIRKGTVG